MKGGKKKGERKLDHTKQGCKIRILSPILLWYKKELHLIKEKRKEQSVIGNEECHMCMVSLHNMLLIPLRC